MKYKPFLYNILLLICLVSIYACKKSTVGYLSPTLAYKNTLVIPKGRSYISNGFDVDGSSVPLTARILHYYYATTGKSADSLFSKTYPVQLFTGLINPLTDTTLALLNAKVKTVNLPPISVNPQSGAVIGNFGTLYVPSGEYKFDLEIKNDAGTKIYPKIGDFIIQDTTTFDAVPVLGTQYDKLFEVGNESVTKTIGVPVLTITRVAETPNTVTVEFLDKNGALFDPKKGEIQRRPATGLNPVPPYLQTFQDFTSSYSITDQAMIFNYPFTPFPLFQLPNGYNVYYRIPTNHIHIDGQPDGMWSANPRFPLRIYVPGAYLVTMQFPDVTRVP